MRRCEKSLFAVLVSLFPCFALSVQAQHEKGVVQIFTEYRETKAVGSGSGFYLELNDEAYVVTCYHVIQNADEITIVDLDGRRFRHSDNIHDEIGICVVKENHDLAVLKILSEGDPLHYLEVDERALNITGSEPGGKAWPAAGSEVMLVGHPQFIPYLHMFGRTMRSSFLKSEEFKTIQGLKIFSDQPVIDLLAIDVTIGAGMSGGPVLLNGKVVGVASGSIQKETVGTIGWAIPIKELRDFVADKDAFPSKSLSGFTWPRQNLIAAGWTKSRHNRDPKKARVVKTLEDVYAKVSSENGELEIDRETLMLDENSFITMVGEITHINKVRGQSGGLASRKFLITPEGENGPNEQMQVSLNVPENYLPDSLLNRQPGTNRYGRIRFTGELSAQPLVLGRVIKLFVDALSIDDLSDQEMPRGVVPGETMPK